MKNNGFPAKNKRATRPQKQKTSGTKPRATNTQNATFSAAPTRTLLAPREKSARITPAQSGKFDFFLFLCALHLAALLVLWCLEDFVGERNSWMAFLLYLPQQGLALTSTLFLFGTLFRYLTNCRARTRGHSPLQNHRSRLWFLWAINLAAAALVFFGFLGFNVPFGRNAAPENVPSNALKIRVLTLNIHLGALGVARIAALIQREKADIVCLQEVRGFELPGDAMGKMRQIFPRWNFAHKGEIAIMSRFPLENTRVHPIKNTGRIILETQIVARGRRVSVFSTHFITDRAAPEKGARVLRSLGGSAPLRLHQMRQLQAIVPQNAPRTLVMGDFNNPPRGLMYRTLAARWTDAFAAAGFGFGYSFRSDVPLLRIDYIWASRDMRVLAAHVSPYRASDHRAVVADLAIP